MMYYYCLLIFENIRDTIDRGGEGREKRGERSSPEIHVRRLKMEREGKGRERGGRRGEGEGRGRRET